MRSAMLSLLLWALTTNNQTKDCPLLKSKKLSIIGHSTLKEHHGRGTSETNLISESEQLEFDFKSVGLHIDGAAWLPSSIGRATDS
jgi:hypothetical protein